MLPSTLDELQNSLVWWREMEETGEGLACIAGELIDGIERKICALKSVIELYRQHGMGLILKHSERDTWGILSEDASDAGRYRWTIFDKDGFSGHCTYDTPVLCLGDMVDFGCVAHDPGALERMSVTEQWRQGSEITAIIQACNAGLISWEEANRRAEIVKAKVEVAA